MKIILLCVFFLFQVVDTAAQKKQPFHCVVLNASTNLPVEGAVVTLFPSGQTLLSDEKGRFLVTRPERVEQVVLTAIGFEGRTIEKKELQKKEPILLSVKTLALSEVVIASGAGEQYRSISGVDIRLRGINNSQEVLRMVPGLFIGQHAGGGKAEQIFLRGFDLDHGTDIQIGVDGMPVNMVSHAHGQGYADLHFIIPELIENVNFKKGGYEPSKGNFATTGFVDFRTYNALPGSMVKLEAGMFNTFRSVGLFDLLGDKAKAKGQSAYLASEYMYTKGFFENPQGFHRINLFGKYQGQLSTKTRMNISASAFGSRWDASGQIPERAVESGDIGYFGAIDPNEGGSTKRYNLNLQFTTALNSGDYFRNQVFYSYYDFELYSNFTFFKEDPVNGDQILQREYRNLFGYNGSYHRTSFLGNVQLKSELGLMARLDRTKGSELSRTIGRRTLSQGLMLGDISENNLGAYISETFQFNPELSLNAGLRYDHFFNRYNDRLDNASGDATASILSPKLTLSYQASPGMQWYLAAGKGFHSNDTRVVVQQRGREVLPASYGSDLGFVLKPSRNLLINTAVWYLKLDQEFIYVGDEGVVEPSGRSRRFGADVSVRYQPMPWLFVDVDLNYSRGRAMDEPKGQDYLPLAPVFTSIGGLTAKFNSGINASFRYRYMADRPANTDYSTVAEGYLVWDAFLAYTRKKYEVALSVQNLFDVRWKETQFDTESRLRNEPAPVSEIHFTPGTPFFLKASLSYLF